MADNQFVDSVLNIPAIATLLTSSLPLPSQNLLNDLAQAKTRIPNWFAGGVAGKHIICIGDSTIDLANDSFYVGMMDCTTTYTAGNPAYSWQSGSLGGLTAFAMTDDRDGTTNPTRPITFAAGGNCLNLGQNGETMTGFLANASAVTPCPGPAYCASLNPDLVIVSFGINDIRTAGSQAAVNTVVATLKTQFVTLINQFKAANPLVSILLLMPSAFTTDNVGGLNFVTQGSFSTLAAAAQACSAGLYQVYTYIDSLNLDNVVMVNKQDLIAGEVCRVSTTNPFMVNQIHPSSVGYSAAAWCINQVIGAPVPFAQKAADQANDANQAQPYLYYPRAMEDANLWTLIFDGIMQSGASSSAFTSSPSGTFGQYIPYPSGSAYGGQVNPQLDVVLVDSPTGPTVFEIGYGAGNSTNAGTAGASAANLGIANVPGAPVPTNATGRIVRIYRHKYMRSPTVAQAAFSPSVSPYHRRFRIVGTNGGYILIQALPGELPANLWMNEVATADVLSFPGYADLALTGATFSIFGGNALWIHGPDSTYLANCGCGEITGTHPYLTGEQVATYLPGTDIQSNGLYQNFASVNCAGSANITLTPLQASAQVIEFTGALTGNINVFFPLNAGTEKVFWNATSGAYTITIIGNAGTSTSGTGWIIPQGSIARGFTDGTNWYQETLGTAGGVPSSFTLIAPVTVTATASETQAGGFTIPANWLGSGRTLRITYQGTVTAHNGTDTITVKVRIGATTLTGTVLVSGTGTIAAVGQDFYGEVLFTARAAPGSTVACVGRAVYSDPTALGADTPKSNVMASTNFATNAALIAECTLQFSSNSASNSARVDMFTVEII